MKILGPPPRQRSPIYELARDLRPNFSRPIFDAESESDIRFDVPRLPDHFRKKSLKFGLFDEKFLSVRDRPKGPEIEFSFKA